MTEEHVAALLAAAVRLGVPILLAALGELLVERTGVVNVGVEGMMLGGALAAAIAADASGAASVGLIAGAICGMGFAALFAIVVLYGRGDMIVAGAGLNLLAFGATGFVFRAIYGTADGGLGIDLLEPIAIPGLAAIPVIGPALFVQPITAYLGYAAAIAIALTLARTGLGLRMRGAGEAPAAVEAAGFDVRRLRLGAILGGGALAGLGGGALLVGHAGSFAEGMTAGRGFIALALVICAGWNAWGALGASLLFGLALALQFEMQALGLAVPYQLVRMAPYVATLVVLVIVAGGRLRAPAAIGRD